MSAVLSTAYKNKWLDALLGSSRAAAMPATVLVHLYTDDPAGGGTELAADGGYAALSVANDATNFPAAAAGAKTSADFDFVFTGAASDIATWGVISDGTDLIVGGLLGSVVNVAGAGTATVSVELTLPEAS